MADRDENQDIKPDQKSEQTIAVELALEKLPEHADPKDTAMVVQSAMFSGPLPPPTILDQYNDVMPGLANRIVTMAENEQAHRHSSDRGVLFNDRFRMILATAVAIGMVVAGTIVGFAGLPWLGGAIVGSTAISGAIGVVFANRQRPDK